MKQSVPNAHEQQLGKRLFTFFVLAEFFLISGNLLARISLRMQLMPSWLVTVIALASALPMVWFAIRFFAMLRMDLDEMFQRIVFEGIAFAMVVFIPLAGLYVNARSAGLIHSRLDPPEILLIPSILVAMGILMSLSRHK